MDVRDGGRLTVVSPEEVIIQLSPEVVVGGRTAYAQGKRVPESWAKAETGCLVKFRPTEWDYECVGVHPSAVCGSGRPEADFVR